MKPQHQYKRKMSPEELEQHLMLKTRARTFRDKKKHQQKYQARGSRGNIVL